MRTMIVLFLGLLFLVSSAFTYGFEGYIVGENIGDQFGSAITRVDFNADSYLDLVVSSPSADDAGTSSGKVYIYYGGPGADTIADLILTGTEDSFFGTSLSSAGDFNNDTYEDLLVGAPFYDTPENNAGAAYIFYGGPSPDNTVDHIFTGEAAIDYYGISVASVGDFNNDSYDDIAIGAYYADWEGYNNSGKVYVYFGGTVPNFDVDMVLVGDADGERLGYSITSGYFNADLYSDIVVGAHSYDGSFLNQGRVYLFYGGTSPDSVFDMTIDGDGAGYKLGWSLTTGNINLDGFSELVVGADGYTVDTFETGRVYVYDGGPGFDAFPDYTYSLDREAHDYLGHTLTSGFDLDQDGDDEILVSMPGNDDGSEEAGGFILFSGGSSITLDTLILGNAEGEEKGDAVAFWPWYGNADNPVFVIGASGYDDYRGRVYIYNTSSPDCCVLRGDVVPPTDGNVLVNDIVYLVDFLFKGGTAPACLEEGDCAIPLDGNLLVNDIVWLVDYLFKGGTPPPPC